MVVQNSKYGRKSIKKRFSDVAIKRGKMRFYQPYDAIRVIEECKNENRKIYGIDAFTLHDLYMQPHQEFSTDYSGIVKEKTWEAADSHIRKNEHKGFVFEIVYDDSRGCRKRD